MVRVCLQFEGYIEVDVDAGPKDKEAWFTAIDNAWHDLTIEEIGGSAELMEEVVILDEDGKEVRSP